MKTIVNTDNIMRDDFNRDWVVAMRQREAFEGLEMMECTM